MNKNISWIYKVFLLSFIMYMIFSGISAALANNMNTILLSVLLLTVIAIGIIFDMIGVSVLTCNESNLHAKAAKKVKGAKEAISLLKNSTQVSSFCNDVIGDICGIISGSLGAVLTINIVEHFNLSSIITTIIITAIISSLTVGCKAISKEIATRNSEMVV